MKREAQPNELIGSPLHLLTPTPLRVYRLWPAMKRPASLVRRSFRHQGFTLLELLVVIAIVAILVALSMASYRSVINQANAAGCLNNLKNLEQLSETWSIDNQGLMLPSSSNYLQDGAGWPEILYSYAGDKYIRCPTYVASRHPEQDAAWGPGGYPATGYSRSYFLVSVASQYFFSPPGRKSQISFPAQTVSFFDSDNFQAGDAWGGFTYNGGGPFYYYIYAAHNNGFNIMFFDGHAERVAFNSQGPFGGHGAGDYPQFIWKPY